MKMKDWASLNWPELGSDSGVGRAGRRGKGGIPGWGKADRGVSRDGQVVVGYRPKIQHLWPGMQHWSSCIINGDPTTTFSSTQEPF